jgi:hypothetical protein
MRELPDSIQPPPAMALPPDRRTGPREERVVELEPAAPPHASGRDLDRTQPARRLRVWGEVWGAPRCDRSERR